MHIRRFLVGTTCVALLGICANASAANIIVGNPLLNSGKFSVGCGKLNPAGCTFFTLELPITAGLASSPVDGAIVRWSMKGGQPESGYAIRTIKRASGPSEFTAVGTSTLVTLAGQGVETFDAELPVHANDYIGLQVPADGTVAENKVPGAGFGFHSGFPDGSTITTGEFPAELAYYAEVQPAPMITGLGPAIGPTTGGTVVKISGTDFRDVRSVNFGAVPATSFTVESESSLEAVAPAVSSPQLVRVSVTTIAGPSTLSSHDFFEYVPALTTALPMCHVPKVLGKRLRAAKRSARRADCAIGRTRKLGGATVLSGRIARQRPKAGAIRPMGAKLAVTLR
jgi:hypothetical protein